MLIACPRCAARYEVADALIGPAGKSVRCARCSEVWLATLAGAEAPADAPLQWPEPPRPARPDLGLPPLPPGTREEPREDPALAEFRAAQAREAPRPGPRDGSRAGQRSLAAAALIGWVATAILLGTALWAAYAYREAVIEAWPPSERVYLALGLRP